MFCPKCATPNGDDARFCRSCGTDISLVPQAVTGALAERLAAVENDTRRGKRRRPNKGEKPPSTDRAFRGIFTGIAFIFVAFAIRAWAPGGNVWWWAMFFPAAFNIADGVSTFMRLASGEKGHELPTYNAPHTSALPPRQVTALPQRETGEMSPPPSVTEGTTRHLGVPVERKQGES